ncbi:MAG: serine protease [Pseudolabrys sp.]|nr:serine protease [Pseudolabrys sp.]
MTHRALPIVTLLALSFSAVSAWAQAPVPPVVLPPVKPDTLKAAIEKPAAAVATPPAHEQELGWRVVADPATGVHIGLPTKMVPHARDAARGTHWSSTYGEVQVETFRLVEPGLKLSALFEQEKKENGRKTEYSLLKDDSFFVSGLQGLKMFSVSASLRNGEVRGFTMLYDQAMHGIVTPMMVAMTSAFSPFPQRSAPFAALAKSVDYGNGLIVSAQGHIVTDANLARGCKVIVASGFGDAERVAEDKDNGLALLRVYGPRKFQALSMSGDVAAFKNADVTLAGIPDPKDQTGKTRIAEIKARVIDGNAIEARQSEPMAGFSGAAALDGQGRFIGMAEMRNAVLASIEPSVPPVRLVRAATIRGFLDSNNVPVVAAQSADASASVVRIICVRK